MRCWGGMLKLLSRTVLGTVPSCVFSHSVGVVPVVRKRSVYGGPVVVLGGRGAAVRRTCWRGRQRKPIRG
jgi:hypothetical protein